MRSTRKKPTLQHATKKSPAQLQREIDEVLAAPGSSSYEEALAALEKKHAGVKRGGSLRAGDAPVVPKRSHTAVKESSDVSNYGTARFHVSLGGLHYRVIIEQDWERGGYVAKLVSEGLGTIMEPNGRTPGEALAALVQDLRAGDATDQRVAARIAQFYWASAGRRSHAAKKSSSPAQLKARVEQRQTGIQWARDRWQNSDDAGRVGPPMFDRQWLPGGTSEHAATRILAEAEAEWRRLQTKG